jgi:hypothetical protein
VEITIKKASPRSEWGLAFNSKFMLKVRNALNVEPETLNILFAGGDQRNERLTKRRRFRSEAQVRTTSHSVGGPLSMAAVLCPSRLRLVSNQFNLNRRRARFNEAQSSRCRARQVDDSTFDEGASVINFHFDRASIV